ncbi:MAG: NADH:ubiquinone oxidoreductase [Phyllobacteriaceae bacterium]|jgi:NADH-quinone oxidoreductase subunit E|nr:NADH:ubiquinone oxidoreductase [Phyllobacteriaceae bacterium]
MLHYVIELALLLLAAYIAGACIGCLLRKLFGSSDEVVTPLAASQSEAVMEPIRAAAPVAPAPTVQPEPVPAPPPVVAAAPVAPVAAAAVAAPVAAVGKMERPKGIAAARGGKADNLQRISGVGPKNEKVLHGLGFFHFDQIAAWTSEQVNWVDDHLKFNGRIKREEWIRQARLLAEGKEAEFTKLYGTGGLRNRQGETLSGSRTRKT